jgi:long-chain acyl-CoA synthetase
MTVRTLNEMLAASVERAPDATAFIFKGESLSYRELDEQIERCAAGLTAIGIRKGDTFGLVLRNCPEFVVLCFALARIGAISVPVNYLEKSERIAMIFNDAEVKGCLTQRDFVKSVEKAQEQVPTMRHLYVRDHADGHPELAELFQHPLAETAGPEVTGDDVVMLIYTAGTTGDSKGVMLTHRNFLASVEACPGVMDLTSKDRVMCILPMFHVFAWTTNVLLPLYLGCMTVVIESLLPFNPALKQLWKHKVTLVCCVPQVYSTLVQRVHGPKALLLRFLNPLKLAISGAAPLPAEVQVKFEKVFGTPLIEGYGLTEAAPVVSVNPRHGVRKPGTVGFPLPGVEVKILDDDEQELARGEVGEICVHGDNITPGYYKRPEETRAAFTADGWLKTGDLGKFDPDGYLVIVDRKKDLIISKGLNIYPQEIEAVLTAHPAVEEAAAIGIADSSGDESVLVYVILAEGESVKTKELMSLCREKLASYKVPRTIEIRDELPKNALGKVLKRELRDEAKKGA